MYSADELRDKKTDSISEADTTVKTEAQNLSTAQKKKLPRGLRNDENPMDIIGFM